MCCLRMVTFPGRPHEGHFFKQVGKRCEGYTPQNFDSKVMKGRRCLLYQLAGNPSSESHHLSHTHIKTFLDKCLPKPWKTELGFLTNSGDVEDFTPTSSTFSSQTVSTCCPAAVFQLNPSPSF